MIYIEGKNGKNYTHLGEIIDLKKLSLKETNDYEILKNMVKDSTQHYKRTQNFSTKVSIVSSKSL
jgi:hypothetical protein